MRKKLYIEVRKIQNKGIVYGGYKSVESIITTDYNGDTIYSYKLSDERFERPNVTYKFIAKYSYRFNGQVKSKAAYIMSFTWSDFVDGYSDTYMSDKRKKVLQEKLNVDNSAFEELITMFENEVDKVYEQVNEEFFKTKEYKVSSKVNQRIKEYNERVKLFEEKYGEGTYCKVKDFYGNTKNIELMARLESEYIARHRYEEESRKQQQKKWDDFYRQFNSGSSQLFRCTGAYTDEERVLLKKFYRTLSQKYHPDSLEGSNEAMQLINKLKQEWDL